MTSIGRPLAPATLACVLAAFAVAALAHGVIGTLGSLGLAADADAYATHAHGAVAPVVLAAAAVLTGLLLRAVLHDAARRGTGDPVVAFAKRLSGADLGLPTCAVAAAGFATLVAMEIVEQLAAFGHADLADALGGNPVLGACVVALIALVVTALGARCARGLVAAAIAASRTVAGFFALAARGGGGDARSSRRPSCSVHVCAGVLLTRRRPSRAPPVSR